MALFGDEQEVYAVLGTMFRHMVADPELVPRLKTADTVVQYQLRAPESTVTLKLKQDQDAEAQFGPTTFRTEIVLAMEADTAHRFFLGDLPITTALSRGDIRASGPVATILKLIPAVRPIGDRYRAQLVESGRADLAGADAEAAPTADGEAAPAPDGEAAPAPDGEQAPVPAEEAAPGEAPDAAAQPPS